MRLSVERLRWGLLAGALLLVAVLAGLVSYGRYRAVKAWRSIVARSGATITHETNGFTYSQAVKGRTIFTLHAAKAVPEGEGRYSLHDAVLVLYDKTGAATDRIYGSEFEYDQKTEVAKALGEVQMDLQPPAGLSPGGNAVGKTGGNEKQPTMHVRTSGLVYVRKLGVAATDQEVEIAYQGLHGYAKGAAFDAGQSVVHLLAEVRAEGNFRGQPVVLTAAKADLDRSENVIRLTQPVIRSTARVGNAAVTRVGEASATRVGSAAAAVLYLRKDGSLERVHAERAVTLRAGTRTMTAAALEAAMNARSQPQHAELTGGVVLEDSGAARPMHGTARTVTIACDGEGSPTSVLAQGAVAMSTEERAANGVTLHRQMGAERALFKLERGGRGTRGGSRQVSAIEVSGSAWIRGESVESPVAGKAGARGGVKTTEVAADDLRLAMAADAAGKSQPETMTGAGHTRLEQRTPDGGEASSTGDALQIHFAARSSGSSGSATGSGVAGAAGLQVASATQSGHVLLRSQAGARTGAGQAVARQAGAKGVAEVSTGSAERAEFDGGRDQVTLLGRPRLERGDTNVAAERIVMDEGSGDAVAQGAVAASFVRVGAVPGSPVTHVVAADASLHRAAQVIEFRGTDMQPARLWQGASQLEAASVLLDRAHDTLLARPAATGGMVHAVFASSGAAAGPKGSGQQGFGQQSSGHGSRLTGLEGPTGAASVVRVASARMDYSGASREAVFSGGVRTEGATGTVQAERGIVFLNREEAKSAASGRNDVGGSAKTKGEPDLLGGSVERIVLAGGVRMQQPGRRGTGEQLLYTAATGEFVLTGEPGRLPHVVDEKQGSITGATLLFRSPDSTIIVAGEPGSHGQVRSRVHTETQMKSQMKAAGREAEPGEASPR